MAGLEVDAASGSDGRRDDPFGDRAGRLVPWGAGLGALAVYVATLAPTIGFGDSPELSAAALSLGVPHPTGYPLLMLLGHGFASVVALGDPAWRLNLLGALIASLAVGLAAAFVQRLTGRSLAGWVAGLALAFSPAVWSNANLFEVYGLHLAFVAGLLWLWIRFEQDPTAPRLRTLTFCAGLAATHHLMIGLILPVLAAAVLRHVRRFASPSELARLALLFVLPFGVLAYLPLAALAGPVVDWGDPSSPMRFWAHVTGRQYHVNVAGDGGIPAWQPAVGYLRDAVAGLTPVPFGLAWVGVVALLLGRAPAPTGVHGLRSGGRPAGVVLIAILGVGFAFGSFYDVVDREPFFLNATLALALLAGVGAGVAVDAIERARPAARSLAIGAAALLPLLPLIAHYRAQDRSGDFAAHDHAVGVLEMLPPDAVLLVQGYGGYPAVYASLIEGLRPDVLVVDHYLRIRGDGGGYGPALESLRHTPGLDPDRFVLTVTQVAAGLGRPLFLVPGVPDFAWSEIGLARVRRGIVDQLIPADAGRLPIRERPEQPLAAFADGPLLLSARIGRTRVEAGDPAPVELQWAWPDGAEPTPLTVWIVAADAHGDLIEVEPGQPLLAHQHPLGQGIDPAADAPRAPWLESVALLVPRALPPGATTLFVALRRGETFRPAADDRVFVRLGELDVAPHTRAAWVPAAGPARDPASAARVAHVDTRR